MDLYIGSPHEKTCALEILATSAHLARDKDLVMKAMDKWGQIVEETKLECFRSRYEILERRFSQWSSEFNTGNAPEEREIESILEDYNISENDVMTPD